VVRAQVNWTYNLARRAGAISTALFGAAALPLKTRESTWFDQQPSRFWPLE
jgi:hypothetical protein